MTEYVRMYAWLARRVFPAKDFYLAHRENDARLDEFEFWLTFYQLLAMEGKP